MVDSNLAGLEARMLGCLDLHFVRYFNRWSTISMDFMDSVDFIDFGVRFSRDFNKL
jgi:hypothetical protein